MPTRLEREAELKGLCDRVRKIDHAPQCRCLDCSAFLLAFDANERENTREFHRAERAEYGDGYPFDDDGNLIEPQYPVRIS